MWRIHPQGSDCLRSSLTGASAPRPAAILSARPANFCQTPPVHRRPESILLAIQPEPNKPTLGGGVYPGASCGASSARRSLHFTVLSIGLERYLAGRT